MNPLYNCQPVAPRQPSANQNQSFMERLQQFAQTVNGNPQQIVQNLIQNGRMSTEQFQQYAKAANQILGR